MKLKHALFAIMALLFSSVAMAQVLAPFITGTDSKHRREVFEVGILRFNQSNSALTALVGGAQGGTALNIGLNRFTTVTSGGDSAQLPALTGGNVIIVVNATVTSMNVFGQTGQTINALSANTAFAVAGGKTAIFIQALDGAWYAILTA